MRPTGAQLQQLEEALLAVFDQTSLARMTSHELDADLEKLVPVPHSNLTVIVHALVRDCYATRRNGLHELLNGALAANPSDPGLIAVKRAFTGLDFDPLPQAKPNPPGPTQSADNSRNVAQATNGGTATVYDYSTVIHQYLQQRPDYRPPVDLPPSVAYFTGRTDRLADLMNGLQPGRAITLCGAGGMGKSALASRAVRQLAEANELVRRFPDGLLFHSFYLEPRAEQAFQYIATTYGEEEQGGARAAARRALSGRTALLILDGTEDADDLRAVLEIAGGCGVLITTRDRGDAPGALIDLDPLPPAEAVTLLEEWAREPIADPAHAQRICKLVGYLPLAVRLAGSALRVDGYRAHEFLEELLESTPLAALDRGERRQESVPLLLQRTVARLDPQARDALAGVGGLAFAPFSADLMAAALGAPAAQARQTLALLVRYSLLTRDDDSAYSPTHRLIHIYARQTLPLERAAQQRLMDYLTDRAKINANDFPALERLRPHIRRQMETAAGSQLWGEIDRLARAIDDYLDLQGYAVDRLTVIREALAAAQASSNRRNEGTWLGSLGLVYFSLGRVEEAIGYYKQALDISREIGDHRAEGNHLGNLGIAYAAQGRVEEAIGYYEQALDIGREIGDRRAEGNHL
ncbi:MAG: tetratricopeptide repeat protein, partial [Caldilineaceae bacterium]|nr:tetratricopeptide repeat protein [Caldilineaceae bacterium]